MDKTEINKTVIDHTIGVITAEIQESLSFIQHQYNQLRNLIIMYLIVLSVAVYVFVEIVSASTQNPALSLMHTMGYIVMIILYFMGWTFSSITSYRIISLILVFKHLSVIRYDRINLLQSINKNCLFGIKYFFPKYPNIIVLPNVLSHSVTIMFAINIFILIAGFIMFIPESDNYHERIILMVPIIILISSFNIRVIYSFVKGKNCALVASSYKNYLELRGIWELLYSKIRYKKLSLFLTISYVTASFNVPIYIGTTMAEMSIISWLFLTGFFLIKLIEFKKIIYSDPFLYRCQLEGLSKKQLELLTEDQLEALKESK